MKDSTAYCKACNSVFADQPLFCPECQGTEFDTTDAPFSLACHECDVESADTLAEAIAAGWQGVTFDPGGFSWNFIGGCPECEDALVVRRTP